MTSMMAILLLLVACMFIRSLAQKQQPSPLHIIAPAVSNHTTCPSTDTLALIMLEVKQAMFEYGGGEEKINRVPDCGDGEWTEVANIDMTNSSQSCPSPWTEVNTPSRLCTSSSCRNAAVFTVSSPYSRVCGRVLGDATNTPDAFAVHTGGTYLDGVSITYGHSPRHHIWSLAAGHDNSVHGYFRCPCATDNRNNAPLPPSFVGENYFCATVTTGQHTENIWDGRSCSGLCCHFHSPPWFNVTLPASTSDNLEVRICLDSPGSDERLYVRRLQLLVQ